MADRDPTKLEMELLVLLALGAPFEESVQATSEGLGVAFQCILNGWIDCGELTDAGRSHVPKGVTKAALVVRDLRTGKVVS